MSVMVSCGVVEWTITPSGANAYKPLLPEAELDRFAEAHSVVHRWVNEFRDTGMGDLLAPARAGTHWQNIYLLTRCDTKEIDRIAHHILVGELVACAPHDYVIVVEVPDHPLPLVSDEALAEDRRLIAAACRLLGLPAFMDKR